MKIILSPAKTINSNCDSSQSDIPLIFENEALTLFSKLKKLSKKSIQESMKLSAKLSEETYHLYHDFDPHQNKYAAIELYNGLAFRQLHIAAYTQSQLDYLEKHLRILSALYGVITPFTPIWPYRLDFVMSFKNIHLKKFWANKISDVFKDEDWILNIASEEYSSLITQPNIHTVFFYDDKNGKRSINSAEAKKARGQTLEYCVLNNVEQVSDIAQMNLKDYSLESHDQTQSTFVRHL